MVQNTHDIAIAKGAEVFDLTYESGDFAGSFAYSAADWGLYESTDVVVSDAIRPEVDEAGLSRPGVWTAYIALDHIDTMHSVHFRWVGEGSYTVSYSLDNTSFTNIANGGYVEADLDTIAVRVTFTGGVEDDPAKVVQLLAYVLKSDLMRSHSGVRSINFDQVEFPVNRGNQEDPAVFSGAHIRSGGYMDILPDPEATPATVKAVEFWFRKNSAANSVIFDTSSTERVQINNAVVTFSNVTVFIDGASVSSGASTTINAWHHMKVVFNTANNRQIRLGTTTTATLPSDINIFGLATFNVDTPGTYTASIATPKLTALDENAVEVSESGSAASIYAYAWSQNVG